jgi:hypothetical protein
MNQDISVEIIFRRLVARWYWVLGLAVAGALLGWGLSSIRPPVYQAEANLLIGIDYGRTQPLSEDATREAFLAVQSLLLDDATMKGALASLPPQPSNPQDLPSFRRMIRLQRFDPKWDLQILSTDPGRAAVLANAWAQSALLQLRDAQTHAWRAAELLGEFYRAGCHLVSGTADAPQPKWVCETQEPSYSPDQAVSGIMAEAAMSRGILPALTFSLQQEAVPPSEPLVFGQRGLILAGLFLGWVVGLALAVGVRGSWLGNGPSTDG